MFCLKTFLARDWKQLNCSQKFSTICRWSQRSSLGIILDEEETNFDKFDPVPECEVADKCDDDADDVPDDVDNTADNDNNETLADTEQLLPATVDIFTTPAPAPVRATVVTGIVWYFI